MRHGWVLLLGCVACGSSGVGPLISPRPVHPDEIRRACAMEVSCFSSPPISPAGSCVSQFEEGLADGIGILFGPSAQDLSRYVGCANANGNCTDALNCASHNHGPAWCGAHPTPTCDGDTLVGCIGGWGLELTDCTTFGEHCATANGASVCTDGKACDPNAPSSCDGNRLVACDSTTHLETGNDCGALFSGAVCVVSTQNGQTSANCLPAGAQTCMQESQSCDGTTAVDSECGTPVYRIACGDFDSHCVVSGDKADCVPNGTDCDPSTTPDSCSGNSLQMCVNGKLEATACGDIGFAGCQVPAGAAARCN